MKGFVVEIAWSQTDKSYVFVQGAKTSEEAIKAVRDSGCNCPRLYRSGRVDRVLNLKRLRRQKKA